MELSKIYDPNRHISRASRQYRWSETLTLSVSVVVLCGFWFSQALSAQVHRLLRKLNAEKGGLAQKNGFLYHISVFSLNLIL